MSPETIGIFDGWWNSLSPAEKEASIENNEKLKAYGFSQEDIVYMALRAPSVLENIIARI